MEVVESGLTATDPSIMAMPTIILARVDGWSLAIPIVEMLGIAKLHPTYLPFSDSNIN